MRKFAMTTILTSALLVGGLAGCSTDNQAGDMGAGTFRGVGTNERYPITERGTTGATYTGEGPITDMFTNDDRPGMRKSVTDNQKITTQNRDGTNTRNGVVQRQDLNRETGLFGINGRVYDRDMARPQNVENSVNRRGPLRRLEQLNTGEIERIVKNIDNVNDVHVVSYGNSVVIGVDTNGNNREKLENSIKQRVQRVTGDRDVYVVTDRDQLGRIRTMGERMREGGSEAVEEIGATFNAMINDLTRAAKRPFERTR